MPLITISKTLTQEDKQTFLKGIAPLCKTLALEKFVEVHHREPGAVEEQKLILQFEEATVDFLESKITRFRQASALLIEFLPQLFSAKEAEDVVASFKDPHSVPLESLNKCFEVGKHLFKEQRYEEAGDIFEVLVFFNPKLASAWLDLGLCLHEQGKWDQALKAYAATYFLDPKPLFARMKSVEAYLALQQKSDAMAEFDELEALVYTSPDPAWKQTLQLLAKKIGETK